MLLTCSRLARACSCACGLLVDALGDWSHMRESACWTCSEGWTLLRFEMGWELFEQVGTELKTCPPCVVQAWAKVYCIPIPCVNECARASSGAGTPGDAWPGRRVTPRPGAGCVLRLLSVAAALAQRTATAYISAWGKSCNFGPACREFKPRHGQGGHSNCSLSSACRGSQRDSAC